MVEFIEKGGLYDYEDDPTMLDWGVLGRGQTYPWVLVREALKAQAQGEYPSDFKLKVWKSKTADDFPWCVKWVRVEEES